MKKICLCTYCIEAIRSRGEKILISEITHCDSVCDWCKEEDDVDECYIEE